jgi:lipid-A-disaccharide synthase
MVLYKTSFWTYLVAKSLVSIPNIALANVVAGKRIVPEFIQSRAVPTRIAEEMYEILCEREKYRTIQNELGQVKEKLGQAGASGRAADIVMQVLESRIGRPEPAES